MDYPNGVELGCGVGWGPQRTSKAKWLNAAASGDHAAGRFLILHSSPNICPQGFSSTINLCC